MLCAEFRILFVCIWLLCMLVYKEREMASHCIGIIDRSIEMN